MIGPKENCYPKEVAAENLIISKALCKSSKGLKKKYQKRLQINCKILHIFDQNLCLFVEVALLAVLKR